MTSTAQTGRSAAAPGQLGPKLRRVGADFGYPAGGLGHWCPGCGIMHVIVVDEPIVDGNGHEWDGDTTAPTILPDVDIKWGDQVNPRFNGYGGGRCHYILVAGVIEFMVDCTHAMKGKRVPLPDLPGHLRD
jgi:hypothetical protein